MTKKFNIVADENMPCVDELFGSLANIKKLSGREITANDLADADALLCRSITNVNQQLLQQSKVQFVGTATIGIDHLDVEWLDKNKISWSSAAGCNAAAVAQYVISGICYWLKQQGQKELQDITVGIVGAGNVGTELTRCLDILGVNYLLCDPPLKKAGDTRDLMSLEDIIKCDVITLHVPITQVGEHKTWHLIDEDFLNQLTDRQLLINAARGEVVDNKVLFQYLQKDEVASVILDVFEDEPDINPQLARKCLLATPHIAGHTLEGKLMGSYMVYQAFCHKFNLPLEVNVNTLFPDKNTMTSFVQSENEMLLAFYDISLDSQRFLSVSDEQMIQHFDQMRKNYINHFEVQPRRDYSGWKGNNDFSEKIKILIKIK